MAIRTLDLRSAPHLGIDGSSTVEQGADFRIFVALTLAPHDEFFRALLEHHAR
jgi:hypothetical protein